MARLPYSTTQLDSNPPMFRPNDWEHTPRNIRVDPSVRDYVHEMAMCLANEINEAGSRNGLRTFQHNMIFDRDLDNREFEDLVSFACDLLAIETLASRNTRPEREIDRFAEKTVSLHCGHLFDKYPELEDEVSSQVAREAMNWAKNWREMERVVDDFRNADRRDRRDDRDDRHSRSSRSYRDDDRRDDREYYDRHNPRGGRDSRDDRYSRTRPNRGGSSYTGEYSAGGEGRDDRYARNDRDRDDRPRSILRDDLDRGPRQVQAEGRRQTEYDSPNELMRSSRQRFEEKQQERVPQQETLQPVSKTTEDGRVWHPADIFKEGENEVDKILHASIYSSSEDGNEAKKKEMRRIISVAQAVNMADLVGEEIDPLIDGGDNKTLLMETNLQQAAKLLVRESLKSSVEHGKVDNKETRRIYRRTVIATNSMVARKCLLTAQQIIKGSLNMADLHAKLSSGRQFITGVCTPDNPDGSDAIAVFDFINAFLTKEFNTYLTSVLGLNEPGSKIITDWLNDYPALRKAIDENYSKNVANAHAAFGTSLHRAINECLNSGIDSHKHASELEEVGDSEELTVVSIPIAYVATVIPFTLSELGYDASKPVKVSQNSNSLMNALIIRSPDKLQEVSGLSAARQIIVTRDHYTFEIFSDNSGYGDMVIVPVAN